MLFCMTPHDDIVLKHMHSHRDRSAHTFICLRLPPLSVQKNLLIPDGLEVVQVHSEQ